MTNIREDKKIFVLIMIVAMVAFFATAFAWFSVAAEKDLAKISGNTRYIRTYFAAGKGTAANPYIISNAEQMKNLAWLQYLGYFNRSTTVYFRVAEETAAGSGVWTEPTTIDMSGWSIPPIGTETMPFKGDFDGNGSTIKNLTVRNLIEIRNDDGTLKKYEEDGEMKYPYRNADGESNVPENVTTVSNVGPIGFFGVTGTYDDKTIPEGKTRKDVVDIYDFTLENITIRCDRAKSLAGLAVGYMNSRFEDVYITDTSDSTRIWTVNTSQKFTDDDGVVHNNLSDYSLAGYATSDYLGTVDKSTESVKMPEFSSESGGGSGTGGWGGSISMRELSARLDKMYQQSSVFKYSLNATEYHKLNGQIIRRESTRDQQDSRIMHYHNTTDIPDPLGVEESVTGDDARGSAAFTQTSAASKLHYLYGKTDIDSNVTVQLTEEVLTGQFAISDGSYYIKASTSGISATAIGLDDKTFWHFEDGSDVTTNGHMVTEIGGVKYYLTRASDGILTVTTSKDNAVIWNYVASAGNIYCDSGTATPYYMICENAVWKTNTSPTSDEFVISNNEGHYLAIGAYYSSNRYTVIDTTSQASAAKWKVITEGSGTSAKTYLQTTINGTKYMLYLYSNSSGSTRTFYVSKSTSEKTPASLNDYSIYLSPSTSAAQGYLHYDGSKWTTKQKTGQFKLYQTGENGNTYYMVYQGSNQKVGKSTNANDGTLWEGTTTTVVDGMTIPTGKIKAVGTSYYLYIDTSSGNKDIKTGTTGADWTINNKKLYTTSYSGGYGAFYCRVNSSSASTHWQGSGSGYQIMASGDVVTPVTVRIPTAGAGNITTRTTEQSISTKVSTITGGAYYTPNTVVPILADADTLLPTGSNTGYILSGALSDPNKVVTEKGDIQVSRDYFRYRNLGYSTNSIELFSTGDDQYDPTKLQIVTRNANSDGYVRIIDQYNSGNMDYVNSTFKAKYPSQKTYAEIDLKKYEGSRNRIHELFGTSADTKSRIYGFQFQSAFVGTDNTDFIDTVSIEGETKHNYEMPLDCIDFNVKNNGYIDFFGGSYAKDSNSFLSLHQIFRDGETNEIVSIKKIEKIYEYTDDPGHYAYKYEGESFNVESNMKLVFDLAWIENPDGGLINRAPSIFTSLEYLYQGALYYFEIPVNSGEYALGAVENKTGAFLSYLDIGANPVDKDITTEMFKKETKEYTYPLGLDFKPSGDSSYTSEKPAATISLPVGYNTPTRFQRNGNTILVKPSTSSLKATKDFVDTGIEVKSYKNGTTTEITMNETSKTAVTVIEKKTTESQENSSTGVTTNVATQVIYSPDDSSLNKKIITTSQIKDGEETVIDRKEEESTETLTYGGTTVITYEYAEPEDSGLETVRKPSVVNSSSNLYKYEITMKADKAFNVYVKSVDSRFQADSILNSKNMYNNLNKAISVILK